MIYGRGGLPVTIVRVGTLAIVGGCSRVIQDIPPYATCVGYPAKVFGLNVKERLADGTEVLHVSGPAFFNLCAAMLFVVAIGFVFVALRYQYRDSSKPTSRSATH